LHTYFNSALNSEWVISDRPDGHFKEKAFTQNLKQALSP